METASIRVDISSKPSIEFNPYNKADGADVDVKTGDQVHQKRGLGRRGRECEGGEAFESRGRKSRIEWRPGIWTAVHNKSYVDANTTAYQDNYLKADMSQNVWAGIGGDGGDHNSGRW